MSLDTEMDMNMDSQMSIGTTGIDAATSAKLPPTEFSLLKTTPGFQELKMSVLRADNATNFEIFTKRMKELHRDDETFKTAFDDVVALAKKNKELRHWGSMPIIVFKRFFNAIKLAQLFEKSTFWDRELEDSVVEKSVMEMLRNGNLTNEEQQDIVDETTAARKIAIETADDDKHADPANLLLKWAVDTAVGLRSLNLMIRWLTDPDNVKIVCFAKSVPANEGTINDLAPLITARPESDENAPPTVYSYVPETSMCGNVNVGGENKRRKLVNRSPQTDLQVP